MKRSTNLSYTKLERNYLKDTALFLRDLGMTDDGIKAVIAQMQTGKAEPVAAEGQADATNDHGPSHD